MVRVSKTGSKASKTKARRASQTRSRKTAKTKRLAAPEGKPRKRRSLSDLEAQLRHRTLELNEAQEQQAATAEILKIINTSQGNLAPVFDIILEKAHHLCDVTSGSLQLLDGEYTRAVAVRGLTEPFEKYLRQGYRVTKSVRQHVDPDRVVQHVDLLDVLAQAPDEAALRAAVDLGGIRSFLTVPLVKDGTVLGRIVAARKKVQPFTDKQIELLKSFAAQAVIAIENARLLKDLHQRTDDLSESLQQQTATADVLKTISRSAFDLQPVFDTMAENAVRLCEAERAVIFQFDGKLLRAVASHNVGPELWQFIDRNPIAPGQKSISARAALYRRTVHVPDVQSDPDYTYAARDVDLIRTIVSVPMLKADQLVGTITIYKLEAKPFTDKQITLVETFAEQAVIAIENVRLFEQLQARTRELSHSLDDLRTAQDRLIQTEKLASLGQLTAGIAHEIKNPLNFVNNFSTLSAELIDELDETLAPAPLDQKMRGDVGELTQMLKSNLEKVVQHGKRADSIVKNMLLHSREGSGEQRPADINALLDESLNLAYHGARAEKPGFNINLQRDFDASAGAIDVFPQEITRAFINLISNGFYAVTKRKTESADSGFEPVLSAATRNLGNTVEIRIRDNGTGIPAEVKEKMFNPFFTTKPAGEGTGLGLSMSHDIIVKQHGGIIDVETEPGQFTEFKIVLPRTSNRSKTI
jgi:two-component system NtrC family sensor kinase